MPHSAISGSPRVCHSPELLAAYHGLHRLRVPRHPPHAFFRLTTKSGQAEPRTLFQRVTSSCEKVISIKDSKNPTIYQSIRCQTAMARVRRSARGPTIESGNWKCVEAKRLTRCFRVHEARYSPSVKEVIQPQVPLRLPCYDFAPVTALAFGRLVLAVPTRTSGAHSFHGVTGGVYKARERIHRGVADPRLLAIPASWRRVAASNPH